MTISMLVLTLLRKRDSYIVIGALNIFGMNDIDSQPTTHIYEGKIGDKEEMQKYLPDKAKSFCSELCFTRCTISSNLWSTK